VTLILSNTNQSLLIQNQSTHKSTLIILSIKILSIVFALNSLVHSYLISCFFISVSKLLKRDEITLSLSSIEIFFKTSIELYRSIFFALKYLLLVINSCILSNHQIYNCKLSNL